MANEQKDEDQKTEEATSKRLEQAREEGQLPLSQEVRTWFMLASGLIGLTVAGPYFGRALQDALMVYIAMPEQILVADGGVGKALYDTTVRIFPSFGLLLLIFIIAALAGTMLQTGLFAAPKLLQPKLNRISIISGWKRIFSKMALVEFFKGLLKIGVVGVVLYLSIKPIVIKAELMANMDAALQIEVIFNMVLKLLTISLVMVTIIAALDYVYQRLRHFKQMRMTKQEVKDEMKQSEGDPYLKAHLRTLRLQRSRRRMMSKVPTADVVITNPTHYAVALEYKPGKQGAPRVVAKGQDMIAQKIRALAQQHDVPLVENPPLARALNKACDIDEEIPVEHYKAVAEIISFVYKLKKRKVVKL